MTYNLTYVMESGGMREMTQRVNSELVSSQLGLLFIITIFVILIIAFINKDGDAKRAVAASSFICFGLSIMLWALGLLHNIAVFVFLVLAAVSVAIIQN